MQKQVGDGVVDGPHTLLLLVSTSSLDLRFQECAFGFVFGLDVYAGLILAGKERRQHVPWHINTYTVGFGQHDMGKRSRATDGRLEGSRRQRGAMKWVRARRLTLL